MEPKMAFPRGLTGANAAYCPLLFRTWSQAGLILARCSLRQARIVKSPWSMTGRQNFWTSRVQAFCSSGVPRCAWAKLLDETEIDTRVSARKNLRIVFLHSAARNHVPDLHTSASPELICLDEQMPRNAATPTGQAWQLRPNLRRSQHIK